MVQLYLLDLLPCILYSKEHLNMKALLLVQYLKTRALFQIQQCIQNMTHGINAFIFRAELDRSSEYECFCFVLDQVYT